MTKLLLMAIATTTALAGQFSRAEASMLQPGSKTDCFPTGNCEAAAWASGYTASGLIAYTDAGGAGITGDRMEAAGALTAWLKMLGQRKDVLKITGDATATIDGDASYEVQARWREIGSDELKLHYTHSWTGSFIASEEWETVVMRPSGTIQMGPIPLLGGYVEVGMKASAAATIGYDLRGTVSQNRVAATFTPRFTAVTEAEASIDVGFASAGAYGDLTLLDATLSATGSVVLNRTHLACAKAPGANWDLDVDLNVHSLDGDIGVFVEAFGQTFRQSVFAWDGFDATYSLYDRSGLLCI